MMLETLLIAGALQPNEAALADTAKKAEAEYLLGNQTNIEQVEEKTVKGYVKIPYNFEKKNVLIEPNVFYNLPGDVNAYTFMQIKQDGKYFGKTFLEKKLFDNLSIKSTTLHGNELFTKTGIGLKYAIPHMPEGTKASVDVLPYWIDKEGKKAGSTTGYFISQDLPFGFNINSFGAWDFTDGFKWNYGEIDFGKKIDIPYLGKIKFSYNPSLVGEGDAIPRIQHRASIMVDF